MTNKESMWCEQYRPHTFNEYVFHDMTQRMAFVEMIHDQNIPHLLFSGVPGSGKTTLAKILVNELHIESDDVMFLNASEENSVDTMRHNIKSFISTFAFGKFKVVILDEADALTFNAQQALRSMMEQYADNARFILTCNYENKIMPALRSRLQQFRFVAHSRDEVIKFAAKVLIKEKVNFDPDILDKYVSVAYPDIRKIINLLEQYSIGGELIAANEKEGGEYKFKILDLLSTDKWQEIRQIACENVAAEEWDDMFRFLYENINKSKKFKDQDKWEQAIVTIAEHAHKDGQVSDRELNFAACIIRLGQIK